MERFNLIKEFLSYGYQLDSDAIDFLLKNENKIGKIISFLRTEKPRELILNSEKLENILSKIPISFEILERDFTSKEIISIEDLTEFFVKRYSKIRNLLSKRMELPNLISINKLTSRTKKFSLVVMIKEILDDKIVVEDNSGQLELNLQRMKFPFLVKDEVVGIVCNKEEENTNVENIISPDIPFKKDITTTKENINCFFISGLNLEKEHKINNFENISEELKNDDNIFFILGGISSDLETYKNFISYFPKERTVILQGELDPKEKQNDYVYATDPSFVKVGEVIILLTHGDILEPYISLWKFTPEQTILNLLKKRHLNPTFVNLKKFYVNDPLFLDIIPDIIAIGHSQTPSTTNYKNTTILSTGGVSSEIIMWKVNLHTRENVKIGLTQ